ncbi:MAG: sigma-70 family RNA polymerase sigma factor [Bacteroidia bacterium]|nr:sigma-70 family RNA polymerase sigma factor [Bacteroidia bacterium]MDW8302443.1 sigma-70 family RNA polymerase sigma factor [Bacteroidia bacterium]
MVTLEDNLNPLNFDDESTYFEEEDLTTEDAHANLSAKAKEDIALIKQAVEQGDEKAYEKLMNRYKKSVYFMLLKMTQNKDDAEDLTMESFAKAFKSLHKFNPKYAFSTWLFKIASNNCIDYIRRNKMKTLSINNPLETDNGTIDNFDLPDNLELPDEYANRMDKAKFLRSVVESLPKTYSTLIKLRYYEELSYEEIAQIIGVPIGTIKAQLHRARELMYKALSKQKHKLT